MNGEQPVGVRRPGIGYARAGGVAAGLLGLVVLAGWAWDVIALKSLLPGLVTMKPNAAFGLVLAGAGLWLLVGEDTGRVGGWSGRAAAALTLLLGLLTLSEYIVGWDLGIDQRLFREPAEAAFTAHPGRMAPLTAVSFALLGAALLLLNARRAATTVQGLALFSGMVSLLTIAGYVLGARAFPRLGAATPMAPHTAVGFLVLAASVLAATTDRGLLARLRRQLPVLGLGVALALLVAAGVGTVRNTQRMAVTGSLVAHTYEVLGLMEGVLANLQGIGAAQRGFVATGMEEFLAPVATAREALTSDLAALQRLMADSPEQEERLAALRPLVARRLAHATESERLRRERGAAAASAFVAAGAGERLVTEIRALVREMERAEEELLAQRRADAAASAASSFVAQMLAGAISLALLVGLFVALHRLNAGLEARVHQRTAELSSANRSLRLLAESNQALVQAGSEQELLEQVCRAAVEQGGYRMAWVGYAEHDEAKAVRRMAHAGLEEGYLRQLDVTWADTEHGRDPTGTAIRTGKPMVARSIDADPGFAPWRAEALRRGYASSCVLPLVIERRTLGALSIYAAEPEAFYPAEVALLSEVAADLSVGIATRRAHEARRRVEEALQRSDELLRHVSSMAKVGGWELDLATMTLHWSLETYRIHEVDPSVQPNLQRAIDYYAPEARPIITEAVRKGTEDGVSWDLELPFITATGKHIWVRAQGEPKFRDGKCVKLVGAFQDITQRRWAEQEIRTLNTELEQRVRERTRQLEEANKELESFSYSVSHDLRAPLRAVDGFARILEEDHAGRLDAEGRRLLDVVRGNAQRMGRLIDDLLAFSRAGRQDIRRERVNMGTLARAAISEVLADAAERERVEVRLGELPDAEADTALMRQVWTNLVSNAVKFTRTRERPLVEIEGTREADRLVYRVRDNGVGFDMAHAGKLFGVFERLHSAREFDGTGVGLALVKRIVARQGGDVWGEGVVGQGATFGFWLPSQGGER